MWKLLLQQTYKLVNPQIHEDADSQILQTRKSARSRIRQVAHLQTRESANSQIRKLANTVAVTPTAAQQGALCERLELCKRVGAPRERHRSATREPESCFSSGTSSWNHYIENVVLFEENWILPLPERPESSGWQFLRVEVSQESPKNL